MAWVTSSEGGFFIELRALVEGMRQFQIGLPPEAQVAVEGLIDGLLRFERESIDDAQVEAAVREIKERYQ